MLRALLILLVALAPLGRAFAFSPEGATAAVADFGGRHGLALGVAGLDTTLAENPSDDRLTMTRMATLGFSWSYRGFSAGVSAGRMDYAQYVMPSLIVGSARLTSVSVGHVISGPGGELSLGLSASRYYFDEISTDLLAASVRWSLKF